MDGNNYKDAYFKHILNDFEVVRALLKHGAPVTIDVIEAVFSRFYDVELKLPLPAMNFEDGERRSLALQVVEEMIETGVKINDHIVSFGIDRFENEKFTPYEVCPELAEQLDDLWRELAGCFAPEINSTIIKPQLSEQEEEDLYKNFLTKVADDLELSEDDARLMVENDSSFRLMLRRNGIDPDRII